MRLRSLLFVLLSPAFAAHAFSPDLKQLDQLPLNVLSPDAGQQSIAKAALAGVEPRRYAVAMPATLSLADGHWDQPDAHTARWRTRVYAAGAVSISFEFARFDLPASAQLWIYDSAGALVQGPYTADDRTPEGGLWTAIVSGESAVIELQVPAHQRAAVDLRIARVFYGFRSFDQTGGIAKSGSCNIDVVCPLGDDWRDEIRAAALITIGNAFLCSGQLLNNTREDDDPLFITADHCGIGDADGGPASSVGFYWNFETSSCGGSRNGTLTQTQTGSTFLADDVSSDFTLLRLNKTPNTAFDVYYAGWSARTTAPQSGVAIHHPSGDEKSISEYTRTAAAVDDVCIDSPACTRSVDTWEVTWNQGTTEQGSSGGGLWDQNHRLVGVLSGGSASCANPGAPDYFARFARAWTANASADGQLKAWLDPDNSGRLTLDGKNPGAATTPTPTPTPTASPTPTPTPTPTSMPTASPTPTPALSGSSGGGAMGSGLLVLTLAALARRRRQRSR
jgi:lysyl endopeptidase